MGWSQELRTQLQPSSPRSVLSLFKGPTRKILTFSTTMLLVLYLTLNLSGVVHYLRRDENPLSHSWPGCAKEQGAIRRTSQEKFHAVTVERMIQQYNADKETMGALAGPSLLPDNLTAILPGLATPEGYLVFNIFYVKEGDTFVPGMVRNFLYHMRRIGAHRNLLLIGTTLTDCDAFRLEDSEHSSTPLYCHVDASAYVAKYDTHHRSAHLKFWYSLEFAKLGYHAWFLDLDIVPLKPFFHIADVAYDFQGLWDYVSIWPKSGPFDPRESGEHCTAYGEPYIPCQSTGIYVMHSTLGATNAMLAAVQATEGWEQAQWQQVVLQHLMGVGNYRSMRYGVFNQTHVTNCMVFEKIIRHVGAEMAVQELVLLHQGYLAGVEKQQAVQNLGLWFGDLPLETFWMDGYTFPPVLQSVPDTFCNLN